MKEAFIRLHVLLCAFSAQRKASKSPEMRKKGRREEGSLVGGRKQRESACFQFPRRKRNESGTGGTQKNGSPSSAAVDRECFFAECSRYKAKKALGKWKGIPAPLSNPTHVCELHTEHVPTAAHRIEFEFLKGFGGLHITPAARSLSSLPPPPPESHGIGKEKGGRREGLACR